MRDQVAALVESCVRDVAEEEQIELPAELGPATPLFGMGGVFDSLALVRLVVSLEEAIEDELGRSVSLADERALSQRHSPYQTMGTLAGYASELLNGG